MKAYRLTISILSLFACGCDGTDPPQKDPVPDNDESLIYHDSAAFYFTLASSPLDEIEDEALQDARMHAAMCAFVIYLDRRDSISKGSERVDLAYKASIVRLRKHISEVEFRKWMNDDFEGLKKAYSIRINHAELEEALNQFFALGKVEP